MTPAQVSSPMAGPSAVTANGQGYSDLYAAARPSTAPFNTLLSLSHPSQPPSQQQAQAQQDLHRLFDSVAEQQASLLSAQEATLATAQMQALQRQNQANLQRFSEGGPSTLPAQLQAFLAPPAAMQQQMASQPYATPMAQAYPHEAAFAPQFHPHLQQQQQQQQSAQFTPVSRSFGAAGAPVPGYASATMATAFSPNAGVPGSATAAARMRTASIGSHRSNSLTRSTPRNAGTSTVSSRASSPVAATRGPRAATAASVARSPSKPNVAHLYTSAREASEYEAELRAREEALLMIKREQTAAIRAARMG